MKSPFKVRVGQAYLDRRGHAVLITHRDDAGRFRGVRVGTYQASRRAWDEDGRTGRTSGSQDLVRPLVTAVVGGELMIGFPEGTLPIAKGA